MLESLDSVVDTLAIPVSCAMEDGLLKIMPAHTIDPCQTRLLIGFYVLAWYLCQNCTIKQLARLIELTTTLEPGLYRMAHSGCFGQ